jgi:hypothetical protein
MYYPLSLIGNTTIIVNNFDIQLELWQLSLLVKPAQDAIQGTLIFGGQMYRTD